jgi:glycosyltransferase involved in cell wall biosynthesis
MRLSVFHPAFDEPGGAELLAASQTRVLRELGVDVGVVTFVYREAAWREELDGVPVTARVRVSGSERRRPPRRADRREAAWASDQYRNADIVLAHNFPANAMLGGAKFGGRKIWYCHEPPRLIHPLETNPYLCATLARGGDSHAGTVAWFRNQVRGWRLKTFFRLRRYHQRREDLEGVRQLPEIWANSEHTRDNVLRVYGPRTVEVVYPIVEPPPAPRNRHGLDRSGLKLLSWSRLQLSKNFDTLLRGFALFRRTCPGASLDIVGDGPDKLRLQDLAHALDLDGAARFHGFVSRTVLDELADKCDVFALLPPDEPFGMVFPEAAMRGLLVVAPDHGGPLEILDGGRLGWMVPAFSPDALADALASVWKLTDAEVDRRRAEADRACRERYGGAAAKQRIGALLGLTK